MAIKAVFVPLARTTFYMPSAEESFKNSVNVLKNIFEDDRLYNEVRHLEK